MASNVTGTSAFPPRKWYRKVPFVSTTPIERRLTEPASKSSSKSTPRDVEDGAKDEVGTGAENSPKLRLPESTANWLSIMLFHWLSPVLRIGYTRPLQTDDLYDMPDYRLAEDHADKLERCWAARLEKNRSIPAGPGSWRPFWMRRRSDTTVLTMALNDVCFRWFWLGGMFKLAGDLSQMVSPLLIRFTISYLSDSSLHATRAAFGLVVGLFLVLVFSVTANVHGFYRSYTTGILLRGALMHTIYRRATSDQLTERAKLRNGYTGVGKLMSLMSADVTRVDFVCGYFHSAWTSILQIALCLALTIWTMGYSALPGFGLLALLYPLQTFMVGKLLKLRRGSMPFTDARVKAVVEAVSAIRLVKTNAYEKSLLAKIGQLRGDEVVYIRKRMLLRALNTAVSYTAPTIASVLAIVCYGATQGGLKADVIFSSLTFFMLLRTPLQALPTSLSAIADARAALERLTAFMLASDAGAPIPPKFVGNSTSTQLDGDDSAQTVVAVEDATFAYHDDESLLDDSSETSTQNTTATVMEKVQNEKQQDGAQSQVATTPLENQPHQAQRLYIDSLIVERDQLVCVVGPVASGKSSIFRALMGDMQPIQSRNCQVNTPSLAYAPQSAWLLSETVRENIVFGRPYDEAWYEQVLTRCCLHRDLERLPEGDMTVVGEMGVSLSGGQKQRISLARAIYGRSPLLFLDDCFSALDADVGKQVFEMVVNQARRNREATVVLVTHSMVLASQADRVVYMDKGRIVEQGEYAVLSRRDGPFSRFVGTSMDSWSAAQEQEETSEERQGGEAKQESQSSGSTPAEKGPDNNDNNKEQKPGAAGRGKEIMQKEERLVGSVSGKTYIRYVMMGNAYVTVPLFVTSIIIYQGTSIVSPLWLTWWQATKYSSITESEYMGGYAAFGIGQSLGLFCMSASFALFCFYCSNRLHHAAIARVLHAPVAFFDTTPQGRITHRFSKDVDAVDNVVGETLRLFISTSVQAIGTVILVTIILPPFLAIAAVLLLAYTWTGMYYRPSARELRRLNNLLRSRIYEHFGESLSGLATLKAFGAVSRFVQDNARRIDTENTAYWLSVACQRWLNLRLDLCGAVLVFITGLLVVGLRGTISVSAGGVVLSYVVTAQSVFGNMIRQSAEIENNMNSVERMLHYAYNIEQEPPYEAEGVDQDLKAQEWPQSGHVEFRDFTLSHRPDLPPALRNVTLDIKPGEKVGIVGRTGAGKTTLISALLRNTEPTSGKIVIDGVDIHTIGLSLLRSSLSVISQDAVLLAGTIRYNLDPFQQYDDAWLQKCLSRVKLADPERPAGTEKTVNTSENTIAEPESGIGSELEKQETAHSARGTRGLSLDFEVKENGANISQGQRSLISIARALVRRSKIVIMDEATASIDGRADGQLQEMLSEVLGDATVLTVAHRLDTIVATCDRVVVMESGQVAEFDGIPELFARKDSIFRSLCDASKISVGPREERGAE
ncbi:Oligomycin resistance ATP-dependent permease YOR1 [Cytospora mali]|uniref:Oligomycin resistance ATP-dependent permease YOR1 n=1 Tax=Cytospora mali TaxID=578113 RepID=A0A194URG8_CYTMA|nr:Oligomycin resistance ATP-dependent permease YOR1 [Valsa mali var. pyri (nom. inval.)]